MSFENDISKGNEALFYFHNEAVKYPAYTFKFDQLKDYLNEKSRVNFTQRIGAAINDAELDDYTVQQGMIGLADAGQGKMPAHYSDFFEALAGSAKNVSFIDALSESVSESVQTIGKGAAEIGSSLAETVKQTGSALTVLPWVLLAGVAMWAYLVAHKRS